VIDTSGYRLAALPTSTVPASDLAGSGRRLLGICVAASNVIGSSTHFGW
jgi:hypothetical protein